MKNKTLRIGSRGSELALWQSNWVKAELNKHFPELKSEIITITTTGDKILDTPLSKIGDKGLFMKEIDQALLDGRVDLAVHSLKDVPTSIPSGLTIGAVSKREDAHDVFIAHPEKSYKKFEDLPHGAKVATGSLRRKCQLLHWRPDITIMEIRGNLNTRMKKLEESDWDGMVLASAGLLRLGWEQRMTEILPFERMLPAVGQGTLAIEIREGDAEIRKVVSAINHEETARAVAGERALLRHLEGGCQIPIGTYGRIENEQLRLDAVIGTVDGRKIVRGKIHGAPEQAEELGQQLAQMLLDSGGKEILEHIRGRVLAAIPAI